MTITEVQNHNAVKLKTPEFVVDYEFKKIPKPFPSKASYMVFVGASRSGKTSLMLSLLRNKKMYYKAFHHIIVVMPTHSMHSMQENIFESVSNVYNDLDFETLTDIYAHISVYAEDEEDTLLIIDDFASELKNPSLLRLFNTLINNRRHLRLSVWTIVQTYNSIPLSNRKTINYLILFKCKNNNEKRNIREELTSLNSEQFDEIFNYVFDKPFEYLVIDKDNDELYKKFNKLIIS